MVQPKRVGHLVLNVKDVETSTIMSISPSYNKAQKIIEGESTS